MSTPEQQNFSDKPLFDDIVTLTDALFAEPTIERPPGSHETDGPLPLRRMRSDDVYMIQAAARSLGLSEDGNYALSELLEVQRHEEMVAHYKKRAASSATVSQNALLRWLQNQLETFASKIAGKSVAMRQRACQYQVMKLKS